MICAGHPVGRARQASRILLSGCLQREFQKHTLLFSLADGTPPLPGQEIMGSSGTLSLITWERKGYFGRGASSVREVTLSLVCQPQFSPTSNIVHKFIQNLIQKPEDSGHLPCEIASSGPKDTPLILRAFLKTLPPWVSGLLPQSFLTIHPSPREEGMRRNMGPRYITV